MCSFAVANLRFVCFAARAEFEMAGGELLSIMLPQSPTVVVAFLSCFSCLQPGIGWEGTVNNIYYIVNSQRGLAGCAVIRVTAAVDMCSNGSRIDNNDDLLRCFKVAMYCL